jgi:hypothetical protein
MRDYFGSIFGISRYNESSTKKGFSVLLKSWESFYTRRLYHRIQGKKKKLIYTSTIYIYT